jgi:ectoine hydroxylase-related dioxygenase (phytanoyl-CoA dioxygenase family)
MWREPVEADGFVVIPGVLQDGESERLLEELAQARAPRSRAGMRHVLAIAGVGALARDSRLLGIARQILGGDALPFHATLFDKSADANWLIVWHQDTALPLRERREAPGWGPWSVKQGVIYAHAPASALGQVLALRVHLDDSTFQNGPLRVLPGTHTLGVLSDEAIHRLAARITPADCPVARGGVVAMRPLLVHSSSKSRGGNPRRVLHIEYAAAGLIADGYKLAADRLPPAASLPEEIANDS